MRPLHFSVLILSICLAPELGSQQVGEAAAAAAASAGISAYSDSAASPHFLYEENFRGGGNGGWRQIIYVNSSSFAAWRETAQPLTRECTRRDLGSPPEGEVCGVTGIDEPRLHTAGHSELMVPTSSLGVTLEPLDPSHNSLFQDVWYFGSPPISRDLSAGYGGILVVRLLHKRVPATKRILTADVILEALCGTELRLAFPASEAPDNAGTARELPLVETAWVSTLTNTHPTTMEFLGALSHLRRIMVRGGHYVGAEETRLMHVAVVPGAKKWYPCCTGASSSEVTRCHTQQTARFSLPSMRFPCEGHRHLPVVVDHVFPKFASGRAPVQITVIGRNFGTVDSAPIVRIGDTPCAATRVWVLPSHCNNSVLDDSLGETDVDSGGECPPPLCNNSIQDAETWETGIDCGGYCPPCPSKTSDESQPQVSVLICTVPSRPAYPAVRLSETAVTVEAGGRLLPKRSGYGAQNSSRQVGCISPGGRGWTWGGYDATYLAKGDADAGGGAVRVAGLVKQKVGDYVVGSLGSGDARVFGVAVGAENEGVATERRGYVAKVGAGGVAEWVLTVSGSGCEGQSVAPALGSGGGVYASFVCGPSYNSSLFRTMVYDASGANPSSSTSMFTSTTPVPCTALNTTSNGTDSNSTLSNSSNSSGCPDPPLPPPIFDWGIGGAILRLTPDGATVWSLPSLAALPLEQEGGDAVWRGNISTISLATSTSSGPGGSGGVYAVGLMTLEREGQGQQGASSGSNGSNSSLDNNNGTMISFRGPGGRDDVSLRLDAAPFAGGSSLFRLGFVCFFGGSGSLEWARLMHASAAEITIGKPASGPSTTKRAKGAAAAAAAAAADVGGSGGGGGALFVAGTIASGSMMFQSCLGERACSNQAVNLSSAPSAALSCEARVGAAVGGRCGVSHVNGANAWFTMAMSGMGDVLWAKSAEGGNVSVAGAATALEAGVDQHGEQVGSARASAMDMVVVAGGVSGDGMVDFGMTEQPKGCSDGGVLGAKGQGGAYVPGGCSGQVRGQGAMEKGDVLVVMMRASTGQIVWIRRSGQRDGDEIVSSVAMDSRGDVYVAGLFLPSTTHQGQGGETGGGGLDVFSLEEARRLSVAGCDADRRSLESSGRPLCTLYSHSGDDVTLPTGFLAKMNGAGDSLAADSPDKGNTPTNNMEIWGGSVGQDAVDVVRLSDDFPRVPDGGYDNLVVRVRSGSSSGFIARVLHYSAANHSVHLDASLPSLDSLDSTSRITARIILSGRTSRPGSTFEKVQFGPAWFSGVDGMYVGMVLSITKGEGKGYRGVIGSYDASTRTAYHLDPPQLLAMPDENTVYSVTPGAPFTARNHLESCGRPTDVGCGADGVEWARVVGYATGPGAGGGGARGASSSTTCVSASGTDVAVAGGVRGFVGGRRFTFQGLDPVGFTTREDEDDVYVVALTGE